jgi:thiol-disulfide isomerase/thioredoxin
MPIKIKRFGATWCGPCKLMAVVLPKVAAEFKDVAYEQFDVEKDDINTEKYSFLSIPYISIESEEGTVLASFSGSKSPAEMISLLDSLGAVRLSTP